MAPLHVPNRRPNPARLLPFALLFLLCLLLGLARNTHAAPHTSVRLLLSHDTAKAGETVWAGLHLKMDSGWHTYWRNPGESGAATAIAWKLPEGITAGEPLWPVPETYSTGGLTTFVYHDEVVLLVPLTIAATAIPGTLDLAADLRWLECENVCVPGRGSVSGRLTLGAEPKVSKDAAMLELARGRLPKINAADFARAWWEGPASEDKRKVIVDWPAQTAGAAPGFFGFEADTFSVAPVAEAIPADGGRMRVRVTIEKIGSEWPKSLAGLLVEHSTATTNAVPGAYEVTLAVAETAPAGVAATTAPVTTASTSGTPAAAPVSVGLLMLNLGLAFVGGLILNLMPCVLPVIALKILGFVNQSQGSPGEVRSLGLIYGAGVLASLLVLAGFVIAVKSGGKSASWGMQFQNPIFVVAITTLVTLVALNLFGVFEVTLGAGAMGKAGDLAAKEGAAGAFFNGVLAVVLATPCSAPFLGIALGFAFAQPPLLIILMFSAVAVGLAFPYVLLSFFPQFLRFLPKPGVWMERFKNAMGFPMLATAVWLLTLTNAHYGSDGILWVGLYLVLVATAAWIWGQFVQRGRSRKGLAGALAVLFLLLGFGGVLEGQLHWRTARAVNRGSLKHGADGIDWQAWSVQAVADARKTGRPVFVDFTADWCITCQANKKTSIEIESVRKRLKEINAVALLGDFTAEDEAIAVELRKYGRAAVPLVLVYPKDAAQPPIILPELLTPTIVLEALDKAAR